MRVIAEGPERGYVQMIPHSRLGSVLCQPYRAGSRPCTVKKGRFVPPALLDPFSKPPVLIMASLAEVV